MASKIFKLIYGDAERLRFRSHAGAYLPRDLQTALAATLRYCPVLAT